MSEARGKQWGSVRDQERRGAARQQRAGDAAEDELAIAAVAEGARDQQAGIVLARHLQQRLAGAAARGFDDDVDLDPVARQMQRHVGARLFSMHLGHGAGIDERELDRIGLPQQGQGGGDRTDRLHAAVPADDGGAGQGPFFPPGRHHQHGTRAMQRDVFGQAPCLGRNARHGDRFGVAADDHEVGIARFEQQGVAGVVFEHARFETAHAMALDGGAERFQARLDRIAHAVEVGLGHHRRAHRADQQGIVVPGNAGGGAADEVGIEGIGQLGAGAQARLLLGTAVDLNHDGLVHARSFLFGKSGLGRIGVPVSATGADPGRHLA